jgi:protocatechuate 3,4-dioxygenase, beta subunit
MGNTYPVEKPLDQDGDLTVVAGKNGRAKGAVIYFTGRVLDRRGQPVAGAQIEIWQANTHGRYIHPSDGNPAPLDPNFEGYGIQRTDNQGWFRFKTIKPGPYRGGKNWMRAPHIHADIIGKRGRIVTQVYFENEALNKSDRLLHSIANPKALIAKRQASVDGAETDGVSYYWEVIVPEQ